LDFRLTASRKLFVDAPFDGERVKITKDGVIVSEEDDIKEDDIKEDDVKEDGGEKDRVAKRNGLGGATAITHSIKTIQTKKNEEGTTVQDQSQSKGRQSVEDAFEKDDRGDNEDKNTFEYRLKHFYENEAYTGLKDLSYAICWRGFLKRTLEELDKDFKSVRQKWIKSRECKALIAQLEDLKLAVKQPVKNVVALGIGSLHSSTWAENFQSSSAQQLAAVMSIRETLGGKF
jgi:hypothetical protein